MTLSLLVIIFLGCYTMLNWFTETSGGCMGGKHTLLRGHTSLLSKLWPETLSYKPWEFSRPSSHKLGGWKYPVH